MNSLTVHQAAERLRDFDNVLLLTHLRPDGDTVGSAAGLCAGLRALGKTAYLLPNPELTDTAAPYFRPYAAWAGFQPDRVGSVDIATTDLFPENAKPYADRVDLAIDHHPSQEFFAKATCLDSKRAACGQLVLEIVKQFADLTPEMGEALYVAVATDCGCFQYSIWSSADCNGTYCSSNRAVRIYRRYTAYCKDYGADRPGDGRTLYHRCSDCGSL